MMLAMSLLIRGEEKRRRKRTNNTVRMTGSTADAAASCGDDTTEPEITSLKGGMHAQKNCRRANLYSTQSCAADSDISARWSATPKRDRVILSTEKVRGDRNTLKRG